MVLELRTEKGFPLGCDGFARYRNMLSASYGLQQMSPFPGGKGKLRWYHGSFALVLETWFREREFLFIPKASKLLFVKCKER